MSTIENIDAAVIKKIRSLNAILNIYMSSARKHEIELYDLADVSRAQDDLENIEKIYNFGSANIFNEYMSVDTINEVTRENSEKKKKIYQFYIKFLDKENVFGSIRRIYNKCTRLIKAYPREDYAIRHHISEYESHEITLNAEDKVSMLCSTCGQETFSSNKTSEKVCTVCGKIERIYGTVFEEDQFFNTTGESSKNRHGRYDPTNHCKYWVDCIQAEEKLDIPEQVITRIKFLIAQDGQTPAEVSCDMYRKYLKDIDKTRYNDHIPLIRKNISKISPPILTENERKMVYIYFSRIVHIFNKIKPDLHTNDKSNCPYHPYFIYKIIEHILRNPCDKKRKKEILSCIHLQSRETLIENDLIMEAICAYLPEFIYVPTESS